MPFLCFKKGDSNMEQWDLYDQDRKISGKKIFRGEAIPKGYYCLAVSVWIFNSKGEILLTLRSPQKESWAGYWENTGGAAIAGETSQQAAIRELKEETGILADKDQLQLLSQSKWDKGFMDIYAICVDIPIQAIQLQAGETQDAQWVNWQILQQMCIQQKIAKPISDRFQEIKSLLFDFRQQYLKE